ncbi:hypothetical protein K440DRAFT_621728 [Wilcoxina mikolae CBS 423.85]|nr:hypothetical protein K440DRAFT_621728 [Wilcoxina mikolae CBS 423.85]
MCLIRVKPEVDEEGAVPSRIRTDRRTSVHPQASSHGSVIETVQVPPPPPSTNGGSGMRETQIVQHRPPSSHSRRREYHGRSSPRASVISTHSRERNYYVDGSTAVAARSPRSSYRYVDGRGSTQRLEGLDIDGERSRGDRYGYNNFHGRKSGSVSYVNPRHSHRSVRSQGGGGGRVSREKVVVVDRYADKESGYC